MGDYPDTTWDCDPSAPWNADVPSDDDEPMWEHRRCADCRFALIGFGSSRGICSFEGDLSEVKATTIACSDWESGS